MLGSDSVISRLITKSYEPLSPCNSCNLQVVLHLYVFCDVNFPIVLLDLNCRLKVVSLMYDVRTCIILYMIIVFQ